MFASHFKVIAVAAAAVYAGTASAAPASEASVNTLDKRLILPIAVTPLEICTNIAYGGTCTTTAPEVNLSTCSNIPSAYLGQVSSVKLAGLLSLLLLPGITGYQCVLYSGLDCAGTTYVVTADVPDLTYFNDQPSSFDCLVLGNGIL